MSELETVFCEKKTSLFLAALSIVKKPEDAEEAVQDGFVKAWQRLESFEGRSQLSTWIHRIVVNAALMKLRSNSAGPLALSRRDESAELLDQFVSHAPNPEQTCIGKEIGDRIGKAVEDLPPILKDAFVLFFFGGCSMREGAETLGICKNAFKARIFRAKRIVREELIEIRN